MLKIFADANACPSLQLPLQQLCESLPERFDQLGSVIFAGRNTIRRMELQGTVLVVKRYKRPNLLAAIGYALQGTSKARKAFQNGQELVRRGFGTPRPYAAVEVWKAGLLQDCFYVCAECTAECDLARTLNAPESPDAEVARCFGQYVARLHEQGIWMVDLNSTNVLFSRADLTAQDPAQRFQLIDINRMKFYPSGKAVPMEVCLENLTRFTGRMDVFEQVARHYAEARQLPIEETTQRALLQKQEHDRRWRRRKRLAHPIKNRHYGKQ